MALMEKEERGEELTHSESQVLHPDSQTPVTPSPIRKMLSFTVSPDALPDADAESTEDEREEPEEESGTDDEILEPVKQHDREIYVIEDDDDDGGPPLPPKAAPLAEDPPQDSMVSEPSLALAGVQKGGPESAVQEFHEVQELLASDNEKEHPTGTRGTFQDWRTCGHAPFFMHESAKTFFGSAVLGHKAADSPS